MMGSLREVSESVWMATSPASDYPALKEEITAEVAVIGGGITGLTTALLLAKGGKDVVLVEADRICTSTTGYTTAKLTSLHGLTYASIARDHGEAAARTYGEANQAAIERIAGLVESEGIDCDFSRAPAYTYTEDPDRLEDIIQEVEVAGSLGLPATFEGETELPFEVDGAIRFDNQAMFHPRRYCLGLAEAILRAGGRIFERSAATRITDGSPCEVLIEGGSVRASNVVQATQQPFFDPFGFFSSNFPHHSYGIALAAEGDGVKGMYISAETPTRSIRPLRTGGRNYLVIGGEGHKVAREADTEGRYRALETWAAQRFGTGAPEHGWSAHDYLPGDGIPYIGRLTPDTRALWLATGFKKWGLTNGTVAAMILADLIAGRDNPWAQTFESTRLKPKPSARRMLERQAELAAEAGAPVPVVSIPDISTLAPGEGRVFKEGGHKVAAYRGLDGRLLAHSAVCTHMGCDVAFNPAERTWDCPCHGSRFDAGGTVVHGPAPRPLPRIDVSEAEEPGEDGP